jgi:hypothetical protein
MRKYLNVIGSALVAATMAYAGGALAASSNMGTTPNGSTGGTNMTPPSSSSPMGKVQERNHLGSPAASSSGNYDSGKSSATGGTAGTNGSMSSNRTTTQSPTAENSGGGNSDVVRRAQQALDQQGAHIAVDGKLGPKTRQALKDYQQSHGLKATGQLDQQTRANLKV